VVVAERELVTYVSLVTVPLVLRAVPPVEVEYQRNTPATVWLAERETVPEPQRLPGVTEGAGLVHCA
jgi:hypothetical protein